MTRNVYVGANLAKKGRESWYYSDKVNYVSTLFNQEYSHRTALFLSRKKKCKGAFAPSHDILWMWRTHLEEISSCLLQGLADSTMELIDSRCVGAQWNSKQALLLFIPFKTWIKQMSDSPMFQAKKISWLLWWTWLQFYYHLGFFSFQGRNPSLVYVRTWYSKNVISVFLMTKVVRVSRLWALCERLLLM